MTDKTELTREEVEALLAAPSVGCRLDIEPDYELEAGCRCGSCWTSSGRLLVSRHDDRMMMEADAQLLAAAPTLARQLLAAMDDNARLRSDLDRAAADENASTAEAEALRAELAEARATLAAERGEAEGAPSEGWRWSGWLFEKRSDNCNMEVERSAYHHDRQGWHWLVMHEPGDRRPHCVDSGTRPTAREAMRAADAALATMEPPDAD